MVKCNLPGCDVEGTGRCAECTMCWYCTKEHQKADWKLEHKQKCRKIPADLKQYLHKDLVLQQNPITGVRSLVATKKIEAGSQILQTQVLRVGWSDKTRAPSSDELKEPEIKCVAAMALNIEPDWVKFLQSSSPSASINAVLEEKIDLKVDPNLFMSDATVVLSTAEGAIVKQYAKWVKIGEDYFYELALNLTVVQHSCRPNCALIQRRVEGARGERAPILFAQKDIEPGESICYSFAPLLAVFFPFVERQKLLQTKFHINCICEGCTNQINEALLTSCAGDIDVEKMRVDYDHLSHSMGLDESNFAIAASKTPKQILHWVDRADQFINQVYKLPDTHWMAHSLRLWSVRMLLQANKGDLSRTECQLNLLEAQKLSRKNIMVNAQLLQPLAVEKMQEYNQFRDISLALHPDSEHAIYVELLTLDLYHEYYCKIWHVFSQPQIISKKQSASPTKLSTKARLQHKLRARK